MKKFKPDTELLKFAEDFSAKYKKLKAGTYQSEDSLYTIKYLNGIKDGRTGKPLTTVARVSQTTGIIELDKKTLLRNKGANKNFVFYIILWCIVRRYYSETYYEADMLTTQYYMTTSRSKKNILAGWKMIFSKNNLEENTKRFTKTMTQLLQPAKPKTKNGNRKMGRRKR